MKAVNMTKLDLIASALEGMPGQIMQGYAEVIREIIDDEAGPPQVRKVEPKKVAKKPRKRSRRETTYGKPSLRGKVSPEKALELGKVAYETYRDVQSWPIASDKLQVNVSTLQGRAKRWADNQGLQFPPPRREEGSLEGSESVVSIHPELA